MTVQQRVIVTRLGNFWVTIERADKIREIKQNDPQGMVDIDGSFVAMNQVYGILTPEQYDNYNHEKQGHYKCRFGTWHSQRGDDCQCARDPRLNPQPKKPDPPEISDEQRAKNLAKMDEIRKKFKEKGIKGLKND